MSQDGSSEEAYEPRGWASLEPSVASAAQWRERVQQAEQRAEELATLIGALIRKYGEPIGTDAGPSWRVALTEQELTEHPSGHVAVNMDPMSGAVLVRFRPEL